MMDKHIFLLLFSNSVSFILGMVYCHRVWVDALNKKHEERKDELR